MMRLAGIDRLPGLLAARAVGHAPERSGRLRSYAGGIARVRGLDAPVGVRCRIGASAHGETIGFVGDEALVMPFAAARLTPGAPVSLAPDVDDGPRDLRGRLVDGLGQPRDGGPPPPALPPAPPSSAHSDGIGGPFETGVPAIDALLPLAAGQRVGIFAGSGVGKSTLVGQIVRNARVDAVVIASIGERRREIAELAAQVGGPAAALIGVAAGEPAVLRVHGVRLAIRTADALAAAGRDVLLVVDSLTRVAHAQRELGAALGEPVTLRGYPASALSLIGSLVDRPPPAAGCVTSIYAVLADGDDLDDPVVDTARGVLDGHIVLSRRLAEEGVFPAIDLRRSLSRIADRIVDPGHGDAIRTARARWAAAEEARDLQRLGVEPDAALMAAGARLRAFVATPGPLARTEAVAALQAALV